MKKLLALVSALVLLAVMSVSALATPFYLESAGITIDVPSGMTGTDASTDDYAALHIQEDDNPDINYAYLVFYEETFEDRWLEDLTDEEGNALLEELAGYLENPSFEGADVDGMSVLIAANEAGTELHLISLLGGWVCDVAAVKANGEALSADEIQAATDLLTSIEFDAE